MIARPTLIRNAMRIAVMSTVLFLNFGIFIGFASQANAQNLEGCIRSANGNTVCPGSLSYPITQVLDAGAVFAALLKLLVGIAVTASFLFFFWNLAKYIRDEEDKEKAKTKMGYSLAAIFVIVTLWGIIGFVRGVLGVGTGEEQVNTVLLPDVGTFRCQGNNVFIKYQTKTGKPTTNATGEKGFCVPENKVKSECCKGVQPPNNTGITLCKESGKCHLDASDEGCEKVTNVANYNNYKCDF